MIFNFFVMNTPSQVFHGTWRHPESQSVHHTDLKMWMDLAQLAERGGIDAIFFADVIGIYEEPGGRYDRIVSNAIQFPCADPAVIISAMATVTEHVGLVYTSSTMQQLPSPFARAVATLDHATRGRIGWNMVTSFTRNAARSVGAADSWSHDERYRRATEYVDVVYKLLEGSWDDGAVIADRERGIYSDPAKVHKIYHEGEIFSVEGPFMVPPSPQRTPVLFQAGSSSAGQAFAARHAEGIFLLSGTPEGAGKYARTIREQAVSFGRQADDILFLEGMTFVVGSTEEEARRKETEIEAYISEEAFLILQLGSLGIDATQYAPDTPLAELIEEAPGARSLFAMVMNSSGKGDKATITDFVRYSSRSLRVVGTPEMICDRIAEYQQQGIDGLNISYTLMPGTFVDFIEQVMPELRRRGLAKEGYAPGTLREKLFPGRPAHLNSRHPAAAYKGAFA